MSTAADRVRVGRHRADPRRLGSSIAIVGGLRRIPFALAFRERMLTRLGLSVGLTGGLGVALAIAHGPPWGETAAVVAGIVQLAVIAAWAMRARPPLHSVSRDRAGLPADTA